MAIIRPNIYSSVVPEDALAPMRIQRENQRADNVTRSIENLNRAFTRQQAIDSANKIQDARRDAAIARRDQAVANKAGLLAERDSAQVDARNPSDYDNVFSNYQGPESGASLGGLRGFNPGDAPMGRTGPSYRDDVMTRLAEASLREGQRIDDLAENSAAFPLSLYNSANVNIDDPVLNAALGNLTATLPESPSLALAPRGMDRAAERSQRGSLESPETILSIPGLMDDRASGVSAAADRARFGPPSMDFGQAIAIEDALRRLSAPGSSAAPSFEQPRGTGPMQERDIEEGMMRDRLQRILNQEYFGTEPDRVGALMGILERARRNEPLTPEEQQILNDYQIFERQGARPANRGGSQQIGPLRRSEMTGE